MQTDPIQPPLLEIRDLTVEFPAGAATVRAVDAVSLTIRAGETLALVGESGSGKSATALSISRLVPAPPARYSGGQILLQGRDVRRMSPKELREIRGGVVGYVFQEPGASLNPVFTIGSQIKEALTLHRPEAASDEEVIRLLKLVGIPAPETRRSDYPHQFSGGMQQRVVIAMALATEPKLLVADEPTTALDATVQAQILQLFVDLKARLGMSLLLITHNLSLVGEIAERVAVMYAGQIVELAPAAALLSRPLHPYTHALLQAVPRLGGGLARLPAIPGSIPGAGASPTGCRFHPRCPQARPDCADQTPALLQVGPDHGVRCPYWNAPADPEMAVRAVAPTTPAP